MLIRATDLYHDYVLAGGERVPALRGVSLSIDRGEYVAVVGSNGSGKTTLALHLNGILTPTSGEVRVHGLDTADEPSLNRVRQLVSFVFQSPDDQLVATIVEEDVAFGPENLGVAADELEVRIKSALEAVGMWAHRLRPPHQLSAGQKQRVALAGALAMQPRCLVLDEATSMLDPAGSRDVLAIVESMHRRGLTIVTVTHKMEEAIRADRVIVLHRGTIVADGPPAEVLTSDQLPEWGLRPPRISQLAALLRDRFPSLPAGVVSADRLASALGAVT